MAADATLSTVNGVELMQPEYLVPAIGFMLVVLFFYRAARDFGDPIDRGSLLLLALGIILMSPAAVQRLLDALRSLWPYIREVLP